MTSLIGKILQLGLIVANEANVKQVKSKPDMRGAKWGAWGKHGGGRWERAGKDGFQAAEDTKNPATAKVTGFVGVSGELATSALPRSAAESALPSDH